MRATHRNRGFALLTGVLLAVPMAAAPALALPDYVHVTAPGWSAPIVYRTTPDATVSNALDSPILPGDGTSYRSVVFLNSGASAGAATTQWAMHLDGANLGNLVIPPVNSGVFVSNRNVAITVRGGLHTASGVLDATSVLAESDESNNEYGRQLSWLPVDLPLSSVVTRAAPPNPLGGTAAVSGTIYQNVDGLRLPANTQPWEGVALRPAPGQDYDLTYYTASVLIYDGFRSPLKTSAAGNGATDFILNNANTAGSPAHDVGILYYSGTFQPYGIEHQQATLSPMTIGNTFSGLTMGNGQMLYLDSYQHVPNAAVPQIRFELTGNAPAQVLHLALFNASTTLASRSEAMADVVTNAAGYAVIDLPLETSGPNRVYGVVVYRDQFDGGTAPATFTVRIRPSPADLSNAQLGGVTAPVNASNAGFNVTTEPTALDGNVANTTMSLYYKNIGTQLASGFSDDTRLDGVSVLSYVASALAPGVVRTLGVGPLQVRGGRHTLSYVADVNNTLEELSETNNSYGKQFVWSPLAMTDGVPITRGMPPDPQGGWGDIPLSVPAYNNVDGLRVAFPPSSYFVVTALVPGAGSDVDLDWFPLSTGPSNGFTTPVISSERGSNLTDLLVDCSTSPSRQHDIGVRKYQGTNESYTIQSLQGSYQGTDPSVIGPATIAAGDIVKAYWFSRSNATTMTVVLENDSGNTDLGLSIFKYDSPGLANMAGALPGGNIDERGAGYSEIAEVYQNLAGQFVCIVVWKTGASELAKTANFRLLIDANLADAGAPPPLEAAFSVAGGTPMRERAQIRFALPESRDASLEVIDVLGRRVRTLLSGRQPAGAHTLDWNGTDERGGRVASGTYFVRFSSGDFLRVIKVAVVR